MPASGPLLVAANHSSFADPWHLGASFPRGPIRFLVNEPWYRRSRGWTFFFEQNGAISTVAGNSVATVRRVVDALDRGDLVGVFPEGRISHDGNPGSARSGIGWMSALSGVAVVPCGLRGAFEALPRQRKIPRRRPVELHIGDPLAFPGAPLSRPDPDDVLAFVGRVMASILELAGREVPSSLGSLVEERDLNSFRALFPGPGSSI